MYIPLGGSNGKDKYAIVDDDDFEETSRFNWHLTAYGYAARGITCRTAAGKKLRKTVFLHRVINKTPEDLFTDHINHDKLDNKKQNLRNCTKQQNAMNRKQRRPDTPTGVQPHTRDGVFLGKWIAWIGVNGKRIHLGYFDTKEEAAICRKNAAPLYHGTFSSEILP